VGLETRFARAPSGPVPYRVDGAGSRQLLIISDWAHPYGDPGIAAFDAFAAELATHDARAVTLLDGTIEGGAGKRRDIERRIAGARAAADAAELSQATLLGAANGAPVAAMLAAQESARFSRLILYDTFPSDTKQTWAMGATADVGAALSELQQMKSQLNTASAAWEWARDFLPKGGKGPPDSGQTPFGHASDPEVPARSFGPPQEVKDGLAQLLQHVSSLEAAGGPNVGAGPNAGSGLSAITLPAVVLEVRTDGVAPDATGSVGMQIAAQIPGAIHRVVSGRSRWPWGDRTTTAEILATAPSQLPAVEARASQTAGEPDRVLATVLFTDIVGSTERLAELGDAAWREQLLRHHRVVRDQLALFEGREIDTAGDGFLVAFDAPARAVRCAVAIRDELRGIGLSVRCGLHTGECEQVGDKLVGIAVHIGARIAAQASADEVLVSSTVRDLVAGAGIVFVDRGTATLKGLPGEWLLFAVSEIH
jgi:class 3 adenylate cyclase